MLRRIAWPTLLFVLASGCNEPVADDPTLFGVNLPPMQGTTDSGAFLPGVYTLHYDFTPSEPVGAGSALKVNDRRLIDSADVRFTLDAGRQESIGTGLEFNAFRIPINTATAMDPAMLDRIRGYFNRVDDRGVVCMMDTLNPGETGHGDGRINDTDEMAEAWAAIHQRLGTLADVQYEVFNEPFGYHTRGNPWSHDAAAARDYLERGVLEVIRKTNARLARLGLEPVPDRKWILSAMGYASAVEPVIGYFDRHRNLYRYDLAVHYYPWWLPAGQREADAFADWLITNLADDRHRYHLTEYGAPLRFPGVPDRTFLRRDLSDNSGDVHGSINALEGLRRALPRLNLAGLYHWHGWNNGDTYSIQSPANTAGAAKIRELK